MVRGHFKPVVLIKVNTWWRHTLIKLRKRKKKKARKNSSQTPTKNLLEDNLWNHNKAMDIQ